MDEYAREYYQSHTHLRNPPCNPDYPDRREAMNREIELEYGEWPHTDSLGRVWLGLISRYLDHPLCGEEVLFSQAEEEVFRLTSERRKYA